MTLEARVTAARGEFSVNVDLVVQPGEVLAITGPNGTGKTTVLHAIAGLLPTTGRLFLDGRDLSQVPVEERRLGVVFQDRRLPPWLSAAHAASMGSSRADAALWLERLGISSHARTKVSRLSGGEAQRVAIARALAGSRQALLLDEPFASLDGATVGAIRDRVLRHARDNALPVVLVTHAAEDLAAVDRVLALGA